MKNVSTDIVNILDGNTFVVSDRRGDLDATPLVNHGLFLNDTRFLSRWILTVNGLRPKVLTVDDLAFDSVQFFAALGTGTIYIDPHLSIVRRRTLNQGFQESITLTNHDRHAIDLDIQLEAAADFADLFEVKDKLDKKGMFASRVDNGRLIFGYRRDSFARETAISSSAACDLSSEGLRFETTLAAHAEWTVKLDVEAIFKRASRAAAATARAARLQEGRNGGSPSANGNGSPAKWVTASAPATAPAVDNWLGRAPKLVTSCEPLALTYRRSVLDLAALRFRTPFSSEAVPAAGLPWFMTLFGRDSLITSFQALPFFPNVARATLKTLALLQGRTDDAFRDEEPGKILHELRLGELTAFEERPHSPYYGSADATPLFLILLEEYARWTGDQQLVRSLEPNVRAALSWIDQYGDRDQDGYVEYQRRDPNHGLENQCWKDSWNSIAFADGTLAPAPRATCEIQGYVYDAKRRIARLAREVYGDRALSDRLDGEAAELKLRFNQDFWLPERGFFALALDGKKRKVDALTSNIGHLLWSGIADQEKAALCVRHLMGKELFSGWGIRTMGASEGSYNPIGYHLGTVWPHDTSIVAWGLCQAGFRQEAARLAQAMLEATELFGHRPPEAFAGYPREVTHRPVEYPTACSPQAWATGAPFLLIRTLLGLDSDGRHLIVVPTLPAAIPQIELLDIPGVWGTMDAFGRARGEN